MKVLEIIRQGQIGGGESHLLDLISNFDRDIVEVEVLSFTSGPMIDQLTEWGIKCHIISTKYPFDIRTFKDINDIINKRHINLIHAHGSKAASNVLFLANKKRIPMIYTVHGWSFHESQSSLIFKLRILMEKYICNKVQQVICVSQSNLETGLKYFNINHPVVIENGVNINKFNPDKKFNNNLRNELGFNDDDYIIGCICRVTIQKDPITFLKSIEKSHNKNCRIKGLLVGNGDMDQEVDDYIKSNKMNDYFLHLSFRNDIPEILHLMDAFCLPSLWEGLSIVLLEAMAMRKPLIVTPTDGTKEIIKNKENGTIVGFKESENMSQTYIDYLQAPEYATQLGYNAQKLAKVHYNSKRVSDSVTKIYYTNFESYKI